MPPTLPMYHQVTGLVPAANYLAPIMYADLEPRYPPHWSRALALASFNATHEEELSFVEGDLLLVYHDGTITSVASLLISVASSVASLLISVASLLISVASLLISVTSGCALLLELQITFLAVGYSFVYELH